MAASTLNIDFSVDDYEVSASIPVQWLQSAFQRLVDFNAESRARDEDPSLLPVRAVRMCCPCCGGQVFHLTTVSRQGELLRACRRCRIEFPLEG